jgi:hypothetical protein
VLSSHGSVMVRVPVPERYAIHKLIVSQLRHKSSSKPEKDLRQAAVLIEVVVERYPGAIEDAISAVRKSAVRHLARAIKALEKHLPPSAASAWDILHPMGSSPSAIRPRPLEPELRVSPGVQSSRSGNQMCQNASLSARRLASRPLRA